MTGETGPADGVVPPVKRGRGRPKGSRNKVSKEAQTYFRRLLKDKEFRRRYAQKWRSLELSPQEYINGRAYAWGKPVDQISIDAEQPTMPTRVVLVVNGEPITADGGDDD